MENLIVIEGNDKYQFSDIRSLIEKFINKNYFNMKKEEQNKEIEKKTVANAMLYNAEIIDLREMKEFEENAFILYDEITYILSLAKFNKIILLEKTDANIFGKYIDRKDIKDNYIIINKFANEITKKYLKI